jgi:methyl-accepting chemotaxis protein
MDLLKGIGVAVKSFILDVAGMLTADAAPGLVTLMLLGVLLIIVVAFVVSISSRRAALRWLKQLISESPNARAFSASLAKLDSRIEDEAITAERKSVATAWREYSKTLVAHETGGVVLWSNAVRPSTFFNVEDLNFVPAFWRIVPGLFVTIGLFLTFLGLIAALHAMDLTADKVQASLRDLLTIASAKFTMSLTGLFCSIIFTVVLRLGASSVDAAVHGLCGALERRLNFLSLEALAVEQLAATREQHEHFRAFGAELVAELARPLREELPNAISHSINTAIGPLLDRVGKVGTDGVGAMVNDLSSRFSDDVGQALAKASAELVQAGDRIARISARMDQSSGKVGTELDAVVGRLSRSVEDLRAGMSATADTTSGVFAKGAEQWLAIMSETLAGIRDNTGEGARAMSAAASQMAEAAQKFRQELEGASRDGAAKVGQQMSKTGAESSLAIADAGRALVGALGQTTTDVLQKADRLLEPLAGIEEHLGAITASLGESAVGMRRASEGVRAGAEASETAAATFRGASENLVNAAVPIRATTERIEGALLQLSLATDGAAKTVSQAANATAASAEHALSTVQEVLGGQRRALEASLQTLSEMVGKMRGQGEKLDEIDSKLGRAFDAYTANVDRAVYGLFDHVREMQDALSPALDTLRAIVEQAEEFAPQSRKRERA